jgi:hypothetical protein
MDAVNIPVIIPSSGTCRGGALITERLARPNQRHAPSTCTLKQIVARREQIYGRALIPATSFAFRDHQQSSVPPA